jgi:hypothetical protein
MGRGAGVGEAAALQSFGTVAVEVVKAEFVLAGLFAGQLHGQRARGPFEHFLRLAYGTFWLANDAAPRVRF